MRQAIRRGEIWWVCLDPARGSEIRKTRPCVVVSAEQINRQRRTPIVVPLSAAPDAAPPVVVSVPSAGGDSVAVVTKCAPWTGAALFAHQEASPPKTWPRWNRPSGVCSPCRIKPPR